jgi:hypothetical protein
MVPAQMINFVTPSPNGFCFPPKEEPWLQLLAPPSIQSMTTVAPARRRTCIAAIDCDIPTPYPMKDTTQLFTHTLAPSSRNDRGRDMALIIPFSEECCPP